jgi:hypothetical protein
MIRTRGDTSNQSNESIVLSFERSEGIDLIDSDILIMVFAKKGRTFEPVTLAVFRRLSGLKDP